MKLQRIACAAGTLAFVALTMSPTLSVAVTGLDLQSIVDAANKIKLLLLALGVLVATLALAWAGVHWARNKNDYVGTAEIAIAAVGGGGIVANSATIIGWVAAAALVR